MRLSRVNVSGFRSLRDAGVTGLNTVNAVVGKNNSGKTALLESFLLLGTLRPGYVSFAPPGSGHALGQADWRCYR